VHACVWVHAHVCLCAHMFVHVCVFDTARIKRVPSLSSNIPGLDVNPLSMFLPVQVDHCALVRLPAALAPLRLLLGCLASKYLVPMPSLPGPKPLPLPLPCRLPTTASEWA